jgi:hypothetical protein
VALLEQHGDRDEREQPVDRGFHVRPIVRPRGSERIGLWGMTGSSKLVSAIRYPVSAVPVSG